MRNFLLIASLFLFGLVQAQSTCSTAQEIVPNGLGDCNGQPYSFASGSNAFWFHFKSGSSADQIILNSIGSTSPSMFSTVKLYSGSCTALVTEETVTVNAYVDTILFDSLDLNTDYWVEVKRVSTSTYEGFEACFAEKAQDSWWTNHFYNSSGGTMLNCETHLETDIGGLYGNENCNEVTLCINDELNLEIIAPLYISGVLNQLNPLPHVIVFANQNGAILASNPNPSASNLSTLTFTQTGDVTFYMIPAGYTPNTGVYQWIVTHPDDFLFTVHVIDEQPEAEWTDQIMCEDGHVLLFSPDYSIFSNVTVDGVPYPVPPNSHSIDFDADDFTFGTHTVVYTLTGACGPMTYTTTFTLLEENGLSVDIDPCGYAEFTYVGCDMPSGNFNVDFVFGDGSSVMNVAVVNGTASTTHQYTSTTPVTYTVTVEYNVGGLDYYTTSGTFNGITPQNLPITADDFVCNIVNPITISQSGLTSIVWTVSPSNCTFTGQGTASITPTGTNWINSTQDIVVSFTATDANGCLYTGSTTIELCCGPKGAPANTEYFEMTYYTHTGFTGMNSSIPAGTTYYAPTNVAISLPNPPATVVNTSYNQPTTLSALIAANGWTVSGGILTIPQVLYINNDLLIDQSIVLSNCNFIRIGPGKRIVVQPGVIFSARNCTFAPKCEEMWGGIVSTSATGTIGLAQCNVIGATNGVYVENNAPYDILSCVFVDNYFGVRMNNCTGASPDKIRNTYFGDVPNVPLLFPYNSQLIPEAGVSMVNVVGVSYGATVTYDASNPATKGNLFHNMKRGIDGFKSTFSVYRSAFYYMAHAPGQPAPNDYDQYCGVRVLSAKGPAGNVTVGTALANQNIFIVCDYGISARNNANLTAHYSYMRDIRLRGINFEENNSRSATIHNNQVNSTNVNAWGIYAKNYPNGSVNIQNNRINTNMGFFTNIQSRIASGIYAASVTAGVSQTTLIQYNSVNNALYGIWLLNISNAAIKSNTVTMYFSPSVIAGLPATVRGIIVQNCPNNSIWSNTVTRYDGNGSDVAIDKLQGIRIEVSPTSYVWKNTMTNTAAGFYAKGSNLGSKIHCNQMVGTYNGFYMEAADISDQGSPTLSAHNQWTSSYSNGTAGTTIGQLPGDPLRYYHSSGATLSSTPTPVINGAPNYWTDIIIAGSPQTTCGQSFDGGPIMMMAPEDERDFQMAEIVEGDTIYDTMDVDMRHYLDQATLSRLQQDPALIDMNVPEDAMYESYVNDMEGSETDKLIKSQEAIAERDHELAADYIGQLDGADPRLDLIKTVETIWNNSKATETPISEEDINLLYEIACLEPLTNGAAVYQARAILDFDGWCDLGGHERSAAATLEDEAAQTTQVFPNPSNGQFSVTSASDMKAVAVFDLKGALLANAAPEGTEFAADFQLMPGIYVLRITLENGNVETHKIDIR